MLLQWLLLLQPVFGTLLADQQLSKLLIGLNEFVQISHTYKEHTCRMLVMFFALSYMELKAKSHSLLLKSQFRRQIKNLHSARFENDKNFHL